MGPDPHSSSRGRDLHGSARGGHRGALHDEGAFAYSQAPSDRLKMTSSMFIEEVNASV
jgi:hypothetical protein